MNANKLANSMEKIPLISSAGQKFRIYGNRIFITEFETVQHDPQFK
jgi:hypothetical protein